jgi:hypothetical protein
MPFPEWLIVRKGATPYPGHDVKLLYTFKGNSRSSSFIMGDEELFCAVYSRE